MYKHKRLFAGLVAGFALAVAVAGAAAAQNVTQGYQASGTLQNGMVVKLKSGTPGTVEALDQKKETDMFGIVVAPTDAPVALSSPTQSQVYVATFGQYPVLVNTQNGVIKAGDQLVISSIAGVAMKSDTKHQVVVGKALQSFADGTNAEGHIKLSDGQSAALGRILTDIGVTRNPTYSGDVAPGVPHLLVQIASAVTNKPLTALRLYGCLVVILIAFIVAGSILYSGIRTGMTSIGRNPLAKKSILRSLVTVTLLALVVVFVGLIAVYLLLKI
ncbi:MAG TPA: hypothetical protein VLF71_00125 [Candidatus Saccharimonadales bacterium]|nr:hypothetical protein [Candidatus Saccharimonadales bacterium]